MIGMSQFILNLTAALHCVKAINAIIAFSLQKSKQVPVRHRSKTWCLSWFLGEYRDKPPGCSSGVGACAYACRRHVTPCCDTTYAVVTTAIRFDDAVWRLTYICRLTSLEYIGPKSRTERPRKTRIGTEVADVTRDSDTTFKVKRSKVNLLNSQHAVTGATWRTNTEILSTCRPGRGHIVPASRRACSFWPQCRRR